MGYNPDIIELSAFLTDSCEIQVKTKSSKDSVTGKRTITYVNVVEPSTGLDIVPCRKEPSVTHSRETDRKFERNKEIVFATHRLWVRKEVVIIEFENRVININGDGREYDVLFVEEYPNEEGNR